MALVARTDGRAILAGVRMLYYSFEHEFRNVPSVFRQAFFAGCLMYDPPPDKLLEYADHANDWLRPRVPVSHSLSIMASEKALGLPIQWIPSLPDFEIAVQQLEREYWETYISLLDDALTELLTAIGVDADSIIAKAEEQASIKHMEKLKDSIVHPGTESDPLRWTNAQFMDHVLTTATPYIRVDNFTSDDDVRRAFTYLRSLRKNERSRERSKRDDLKAIQCAIWYDEYEWSHERIAEYFGWAVQHPPAQKPRSETARQHIAHGRDLLKHKSSVP
jgi:hypothetical protein